MRIRYFADIRFPIERANGVQTMETCHALARRGHHVHLVVRPDSAVPARDPFAYYGLPPVASLVIERVAVPRQPSARRAVFLVQVFRRTLAARHVDVIMTRDLAIASIALRLPAGWRPPIVYESHGFAPAVSAELSALHAHLTPGGAAKLRRLEARERQVWRDADGYVTITSGLARELAGRFGDRRRVATVADGTRLPAPGPEPPRPARAAGAGPVIGYAGHLYSWKGIDVLIAALGHLPGMQGLVVGGLDGEPDAARVRALADRLAPGRVRFTGQVDPPQVAALIREADVLVIPNLPTRTSTTYTSPLKLFEYMASGRPIVASDLPAFREVLRPDGNAVLVAPGDEAALADGIRRVVTDGALAARIAAQAKADVTGYSWDKRAERLEAVLAAAAGSAA